MSYPSINKHLETQGTTLEMATEEQLSSAFLSAFREDLSLGMAQVDNLVNKLDEVGERAMLTLAPNSDEGKQFARLLGPDIPRKVLENHYGVSFGFYNCCKGVVAKNQNDLMLNMREQAEAQHPNFVDC